MYCNFIVDGEATLHDLETMPLKISCIKLFFSVANPYVGEDKRNMPSEA